jgi:hypothetical protein
MERRAPAVPTKQAYSRSASRLWECVCVTCYYSKCVCIFVCARAPVIVNRTTWCVCACVCVRTCARVIIRITLHTYERVCVCDACGRLVCACVCIQICKHRYVCVWRCICVNVCLGVSVRACGLHIPRREYSTDPDLSLAVASAPLATNSRTTLYLPKRAASWSGVLLRCKRTRANTRARAIDACGTCLCR